MIVIQTYTKKAGEGFENLTSAVTFESLKRRLRLYYKNIGKVKAMLYAGEKISMPYVEIQKDRRIKKFIRVKNERRSALKLS